MRSIIKLSLLLTVVVMIFFCLQLVFKSSKGGKYVSSHQSVVEKVEAIGRLELVKMNIRDVVEHQLVRQWLPNASALLIINGEAVGCIDLQKIRPEDIVISGDTLKIKLPQPELCYCKINHEKSKIYETKYDYFISAELVDSAYREAEKQLNKTVLESGILEQTKQNAVLLLKPLLSTFGFQTVIISF